MTKQELLSRAADACEQELLETIRQEGGPKWNDIIKKYILCGMCQKLPNGDMPNTSEALNIAAECAEAYKVKPDRLFKRGRRQPDAIARFVAMALCYEMLGWSYEQVGRFFKRDRTTAGHAINAIANLPRGSQERKKPDEIRERLKKP